MHTIQMFAVQYEINDVRVGILSMYKPFLPISYIDYQKQSDAKINHLKLKLTFISLELANSNPTWNQHFIQLFKNVNFQNIKFPKGFQPLNQQNEHKQELKGIFY